MAGNEEMNMRLSKLERMRKMGVQVYPQTYAKKHTVSSILARSGDFREVETVLAAPSLDTSTAGRIVLFRSFGKIAFAHLQDDTGRIQIMFAKENCKIRID